MPTAQVSKRGFKSRNGNKIVLNGFYLLSFHRGNTPSITVGSTIKI